MEPQMPTTAPPPQDSPQTPEDKLTAINQVLAKKQQAGMQSAFDPAAISQAMASLDPGGRDPAVQVGKAISTPAYAGFCQQFVDDTTGASIRYPTAAATWQAKVQSGQAHTGLDGMKPGDVVEFAPDQGNGMLGHAAVVQKNGTLKMATNSGVETYSLKNWLAYSGQTPEGYYSGKPDK